MNEWVNEWIPRAEQWPQDAAVPGGASLSMPSLEVEELARTTMLSCSSWSHLSLPTGQETVWLPTDAVKWTNNAVVFRAAAGLAPCRKVKLSVTHTCSLWPFNWQGFNSKGGGERWEVQALKKPGINCILMVGGTEVRWQPGWGREQGGLAHLAFWPLCHYCMLCQKPDGPGMNENKITSERETLQPVSSE